MSDVDVAYTKAENILKERNSTALSHHNEAVDALNKKKNIDIGGGYSAAINLIITEYNKKLIDSQLEYDNNIDVIKKYCERTALINKKGTKTT